MAHGLVCQRKNVLILLMGTRYVNLDVLYMTSATKMNRRMETGNDTHYLSKLMRTQCVQVAIAGLLEN